jgi:hypothetical protein
VEVGIDESHRYSQHQQEELVRWEAKCGRCGACCGAYDGDPCEHLRQSIDKKYFCSIYEHRFGEHKTKSGKIINCVPIRQILNSSWLGDHCCGYKK